MKYKCTHCGQFFSDKSDEGILSFRGKMYCKNCEEPVIEIPDLPQVDSAIHGAHATLISNSDNRITTNNYYGVGIQDEQVETPYGICRKSESRICNKCHQWVPLSYFNQERIICCNCESMEAREIFDEGKSFFEMRLYDDAITCFLKYESVCSKESMPEVKTLLGRCYYEQKDYKQAIKYFVVASRNNSDSLYYLGLCYYYGYEVICDVAKAQELIRKAAELKHQQAIDFLAKLFAEKQNKTLENEVYYPIKYKGKYGFMDRTGKIVIPCQWEEVEEFSEGLAKVKDFDGNYGFVDKTGKVVIPCKWQRAVFFYEGLAVVQNQNDKWGFINIIGKEVIPCKWERAIRFHEGLACVEDQNGKCGFIDNTGKIVIPCEWNYAIVFKEGLARVQNQDGKYGFIDKTGNVVIPCEWMDADDFNEGLAKVEDYNFGTYFIDKNGNVAIQDKRWWHVHDFHDGFAEVVNKDGKCGFIDKTGTLVVPFQWEEVCSFNEGLAAVCGQEDEQSNLQDKKQIFGSKWVFVDKTTKAVLSGQWKSALSKVGGNLTSIKNNEKKTNNWGFIDKTGAVVIPCKWNKVFYEFHGGLAAVRNHKYKWGFIDKTGKVVIPCQWNEVLDFFHEGLARVADEYGNEIYVDRYGDIIAPRE